MTSNVHFDQFFAIALCEVSQPHNRKITNRSRESKFTCETWFKNKQTNKQTIKQTNKQKSCLWLMKG